MGKYFGTDGFRGEANVDLTASHAYKIGRFLGWYYKSIGKEGKVVIGKDTRRSSYMLEYALVSGIVAGGGNPYLLHVCTTPNVAYVTRTEDFDCGVMISASHNLFQDNGIKLFNENGEKADEVIIAKIEAYIDNNMEELGFEKGSDLPIAKGAEIGKIEDYFTGRNRYMAYLISLATHSYKGMKVGIDASNGASYSVVKGVFEALGAKVFMINDEPNGLNINVDCGSTHIQGLQKFVVENHLDVGFAMDGDADRCLAVDEKGNVVNGDLILYIYGRYMKERDKLVSNTIATTIMSNFGLYKALDEIDVNYVKTAVGDKYVYEAMSKNGYEIGGEDSGHIIFKKYATTGDGILTAMKLMQVMLAKKSTLSALAQPVTIYPQVLKNIRVTNKKEAQDDADVQAQVAKVTNELGNTGRILVRESGTEPVVRVMVEAESIDTCERLVDSVIDVIKAKGYVK